MKSQCFLFISYIPQAVCQGSLQPGLPQAYTNKEASKQMRQSTLFGQRTRKREAQQGPVGSVILPPPPIHTQPQRYATSTYSGGISRTQIGQHIFYQEWWTDMLAVVTTMDPKQVIHPLPYIFQYQGGREHIQVKIFSTSQIQYIPTSDGQLRKQPFTLCRWYQQGLIRSS